jgi:hypothetical protein
MLLREARRLSRRTFKLGNALVGGLVVWVLLGSTPTTAAFLSVTRSDGSNVLSTAKQFTISDVTAVAQPGGHILVSWSAASWAGGGYSVRRGALPAGPFAEIVVVAAGVTTYDDPGVVNGQTYSYQIFGVSSNGGMGIGSNVATATADSSAPTVASTVPSAATTDVALNATARVTFSEPMNAVLTAANAALVDCGSSSTCGSGTSAISASPTWPTTSSLLLTPTTPLTASHWIGIQLTTSATDLTGNALSCTGATAQAGSTCYWTFQTGTTTGTPGLDSSAPRDGATDVPTNTAISFKWSAALNATGQSAALAGFSLEQITGTGAPCFAFSGSGQTPQCAAHGGTWTNPTAATSRLVPTTALLPNTNYGVTESASDAANLVVSYSATWTTGAGTDTTPPTVTRLSPADTASGISPTTTVQVTFSEPMDVARTTGAFSLQPWSVAGACSGSLGSAVTGSFTWNNASEFVFHPAADLTANTCFHLSIDTTATDVAGNAFGAGYAGSNFLVLNGTPPTISLTSGAYYYPGATVTASGTGWSAGSGNVVPKWDDVTVLDASGAALTSNAFSGYTFSLPTSATSGNHSVSFVRSGGATISVPVTIQSPSSITLSASRTDISAGSSTVISSTVYDAGKAAANARVSFAITTDTGARGSFTNGSVTTSTSGITDGSGHAPAVTLYVSAGARFDPIEITATSGGASRTITIIDPAPLPPSGLHLSASDRLEMGWRPSPTSTVTGYKIGLGTATGVYDRTIDAGPTTSYTELNVVAGQTYYVVVRAYDAHGALSDPSHEVRITMPGLLATQLVLTGANPPVGVETTQITATVQDQYGRPLPRAQVTFSAPAGVTLESALGTTTTDGTLGARITRVDTSVTTVTLKAASGSATGSLDIAFAPIATLTPTATATATGTTTATASPTPTTTPTAGSTLTPGILSSTTPTVLTTATAIVTPSATLTPVGTLTPEPTVLTTPVAEPTAIEAPGGGPLGGTPSSTPTPSGTLTPGSTSTPTPPPTASSTPTSASTQTPTRTPTRTPTQTVTAVPTATLVPLSVGSHDDGDAGITYSAGWSAANSAHQTTTIGRTATFGVGGDAASVTVWWLASSGGSLEVFEDGTLRGSVAEGSSAGHTSVTLPGSGRRTIVLAAQTSGATVTFDRVDVVGSLTPTPTPSLTPTATPTASVTPTGTLTLTATPSATPTPAGSGTPTGSATLAATSTATATPAAATATPGPGTPTALPTATSTTWPTASATPATPATATPLSTATALPTNTPLPTPTPVPAPTSTPVPTAVPTTAPTATHVPTATAVPTSPPPPTATPHP